MPTVKFLLFLVLMYEQISNGKRVVLKNKAQPSEMIDNQRAILS